MSPLDFRLLRARLGLSQAEVAQVCSVQDRAVRRWESGDRTPGEEHVAALLRLLAQQDRAVSETTAHFNRLALAEGRPDRVDLAFSLDDAQARSRGWPCAGAWLAVLRRVAEAVAPAAVHLVDPGDSLAPPPH